MRRRERLKPPNLFEPHHAQPARGLREFRVTRGPQVAEVDGAERALTALEQALHQALMLRTGVMSPQARLSMQVRAWGQNTDAETLTELIRSVFDTRRKRQSQVNWQASLDHLLMKLLEAKTAWQQS